MYKKQMIALAVCALLMACSPSDDNKATTTAPDAVATQAKQVADTATTTETAHADTTAEAGNADAHDAATEHHAPHFTYDGDNGPANWGTLSEDWAACSGTGNAQSPVDIVTANAAANSAAAALVTDYKDAALDVKNNGHSITVSYPAGSSLTIGGSSYELLQFHFHAASEHTIDGQHSDLVAHLVHKNAEGQLAVIGVLLNEGEANNAIDAVWSNMPKDAGTNNAPEGVSINAASLLPADMSYYHYNGSLTTPPCSEIVSWYVLKNAVTVSKAQIAAFRVLYSDNVRPVQNLHERNIESN
ncbi:MAG: carbonic anhydrase family protein [Mariprofundales bacterium]